MKKVMKIKLSLTKFFWFACLLMFSQTSWNAEAVDFKGTIIAVAKGEALDQDAEGGRGYIGEIKIPYLLGTFFGEPVCKYGFYWDWIDKEKLVIDAGSQMKYTDLNEYPDLKERFTSMVPINIYITVDMVLYTGNRWIGLVELPIKYSQLPPIGKAGEMSQDMVPGSPKWQDFFKIKKALYSDNKSLFMAADRLEFENVRITRIEWARAEGIANDYKNKTQTKSGSEKTTSSGKSQKVISHETIVSDEKDAASKSSLLNSAKNSASSNKNVSSSNDQTSKMEELLLSAQSEKKPSLKEEDNEYEDDQLTKMLRSLLSTMAEQKSNTNLQTTLREKGYGDIANALVIMGAISSMDTTDKNGDTINNMGELYQWLKDGSITKDTQLQEALEEEEFGDIVKGAKIALALGDALQNGKNGDYTAVLKALTSGDSSDEATAAAVSTLGSLLASSQGGGSSISGDPTTAAIGALSGLLAAGQDDGASIGSDLSEISQGIDAANSMADLFSGNGDVGDISNALNLLDSLGGGDTGLGELAQGLSIANDIANIAGVGGLDSILGGGGGIPGLDMGGFGSAMGAASIIGGLFSDNSAEERRRAAQARAQAQAAADRRAKINEALKELSKKKDEISEKCNNAMEQISTNKSALTAGRAKLADRLKKIEDQWAAEDLKKKDEFDAKEKEIDAVAEFSLSGEKKKTQSSVRKQTSSSASMLLAAKNKKDTLQDTNKAEKVTLSIQPAVIAQPKSNNSISLLNSAKSKNGNAIKINVGSASTSKKNNPLEKLAQMESEKQERLDAYNAAGEKIENERNLVRTKFKTEIAKYDDAIRKLSEEYNKVNSKLNEYMKEIAEAEKKYKSMM